MDLAGAFLLHTAPNVRKVGPGKYEKLCIGTTTSARMVDSPSRSASSTACGRSAARAASRTRRSSPMRKHGWSTFAIVGGAAALETTQIEEIEEVAWEELMPECLWKFRVKDFGPLTVGIDAHGNSLYHDVQAAAQEKLKELYAARLSTSGSPATAASPTSSTRALARAPGRTCSRPPATTSTSSSSAGAPPG
jgi:L(+)-tartrate dehydratase beta subunit